MNLEKLSFNRKSESNLWKNTPEAIVQKPDRFVAKRGYKQIERLTSAGRNRIIISCIIKIIMFPRNNCREHFVCDKLCGS